MSFLDIRERLMRNYQVDSEGGFSSIALSQSDLMAIKEKDGQYGQPVVSRTLEALAVGDESLYDRKGLLVADRSLQRVEAILIGICNLNRD